MSFADLVTAADRAAQNLLGGVTVGYRSGAGELVEVRGMFDERFQLAQPDGAQVGVESIAPAVFLRLSDLPTDPRDDDPTITVAGISYTVHERQPDGMGGIRLLLHRAGA